MAEINLYVGNDHIVEVSGLKNALTGVILTGATVQVTVSRGGTPISGQSWPLTLNHVEATPGTYRGTLSQGLDLEAGRLYKIVVTANGGPGLVGTWTVISKAIWRV